VRVRGAAVAERAEVLFMLEDRRLSLIIGFGRNARGLE